MIRPILDGLIVRMDPPAERVGSIVIPDDARAETGTWRAKREAKIGTVLAVGPGRVRRKKAGKGKNGAQDYDRVCASVFVPCEVRVGDRVLFDPLAELRPLPDGTWQGAEYQVAGVACRACQRFMCTCVDDVHVAAAAAWDAVAAAAEGGE